MSEGSEYEDGAFVRLNGLQEVFEGSALLSAQRSFPPQSLLARTYKRAAMVSDQLECDAITNGKSRRSSVTSMCSSSSNA